ncbi:MAG: hypothetical protein MJ181_11445 [Treponema sp.]|nr:hypothetical protein [Treponema sp.]
MPKVNTHTNGSLSEAEWNMRKTFIDAFREGKISRSDFIVLWGSCQMVKNIKEGAE